MKYYIITGASKGLGKSFLELLNHKNEKIVAISRSFDNALLNDNVRWVPIDLSNIDELLGKLDIIFSDIKTDEIESITLINNAAGVGKPGDISISSPQDIQKVINLNFTSASILIGEFLKRYNDFPFKKNIINISSGAASRIISGLSLYCSTKASLNMLTKVVAEEQRTKKYPAKIFAISPGMIETDMQKKLRDTNEASFRNKKIFLEAKKDGIVRSPIEAAKLILSCLDNAIEIGEIVHINDLL